jgi:hypothetical protein
LSVVARPASKRDESPPGTTDLTPQSLAITQDELEFIEVLTPLLDPTPRTIKRFVNTYRLIKVSLSPTEQFPFIRQHQSQISNFQIVLFLLAIVTGTHGISEVFLETLLRRNSERDLQTVLARMEQELQHSSSDHWKRLLSWLALLDLRIP